MAKKPPYSHTKLRITSHEDDIPGVGDELRTAAGSRYQILQIRGMTHHCLTLPPEAEEQGKVFTLRWNPRPKRRD